MFVNNEIGVIQDIAAIGAICREKGIVFHVDAAQATGRVAFDLSKLPVDLMSLTAHKTYGPKGIGALFVRRKPRVRIEAQMHGGGHERGMRSGTLPTHQIVGMGEAYRIAKAEMAAENVRIKALHDRIGRERGWGPTTKESFLNEVRHGSTYAGSPETVAKKIRGMTTDPARVRRTDPGDPARCPVWQLHQVYSDDACKEWVQQGCKTAGIGCIECKQPVIDGILKEQVPMRERAQMYLDDPTLVKNIIADGCEKARELARETMRDVREAMGLEYH
mgnify:CR=1 FL=1